MMEDAVKTPVAAPRRGRGLTAGGRGQGLGKLHRRGVKVIEIDPTGTLDHSPARRAFNIASPAPRSPGAAVATSPWRRQRRKRAGTQLSQLQHDQGGQWPGPPEEGPTRRRVALERRSDSDSDGERRRRKRAGQGQKDDDHPMYALAAAPARRREQEPIAKKRRRTALGAVRNVPGEGDRMRHDQAHFLEPPFEGPDNSDFDALSDEEKGVELLRLLRSRPPVPGGGRARREVDDDDGVSAASDPAKGAGEFHDRSRPAASSRAADLDAPIPRRRVSSLVPSTTSAFTKATRYPDLVSPRRLPDSFRTLFSSSLCPSPSLVA